MEKAAKPAASKAGNNSRLSLFAVMGYGCPRIKIWGDPSLEGPMRVMYRNMFGLSMSRPDSGITVERVDK